MQATRFHQLKSDDQLPGLGGANKPPSSSPHAHAPGGHNTASSGTGSSTSSSSGIGGIGSGGSAAYTSSSHVSQPSAPSTALAPITAPSTNTTFRASGSPSLPGRPRTLSSTAAPVAASAGAAALVLKDKPVLRAEDFETKWTASLTWCVGWPREGTNWQLSCATSYSAWLCVWMCVWLCVGCVLDV